MQAMEAPLTEVHGKKGAVQGMVPLTCLRMMARKLPCMPWMCHQVILWQEVPFQAWSRLPV